MTPPQHPRRGAALRGPAICLLALCATLLTGCPNGGDPPDTSGGTPWDSGPADTGPDDTGADEDTSEDTAVDSAGTGDTGVDDAADTSDPGDVGGDAGDAGGDAGGEGCVPNGHACVGNVIHKCGPDGTATDEVIKKCAATEVCAPNTSQAALRVCALKLCEPNATACKGKSVQVCNKWGTGNTFTSCKGFICQAGKCTTLKCVPKEQRCEGDQLWACNDDGSEDKNVKNCASDESCVADAANTTASCVKQICVKSNPACDGETLTQCSGDGTKLLPGGKDCTKNGNTCIDPANTGGTGAAACVAPKCGDGKVNGPTSGPNAEQCDQGAKNGQPGVLCSATCKTLSNACLTVADCKALSLPPCSLGWGCVAGKCTAKPSISELCDDGDPCTVADKCSGGTCVGLPRDCDDGKVCTTDACDPKAGKGDKACTHVQVQGPCDDGNACTVGEKCQFGKCTAGSAVCECTKDSQCDGYDDGNPCTGKMACVAGQCAPDPKSLPVCGSGICRVAAPTKAECEKAKGVWASGTGECLFGTANTEATCKAAGHSWVDAGPCRIAQCAPDVGQCVLKSIFDGTACTDGDACTGPDACAGGKCSGKPVVCDDDNACTDDSCDPKSGCAHKANTSPCDDGNSCTGGDACKDGGCVGTGTCQCEKDADCAKYSAKDDKCAGVWTCQGKTCALDPKTVVKCDPAKDTLCIKNLCDKADGTCKATDLPAGATCTDGSVCTKVGGCKDGKCEGQDTVVDCDDGNPCTADTCDPKLGCLFSANNAPCDDGDPCSKGDACKGGQCAPGKDECGCSKDADCAGLATGNKCLGGYKCVVSAGKCMWDPAKSVICGYGVCSDGKSTTKSACQSGGATWSPDSSCASTVCDPTTGQCKQSKKADGAACSDGSPCTLGDSCKGGACEGKANSCDDFNPCTTDACDPKVLGGCTHDAKTLEGKDCEDGDLCTDASKCDKGKCVGAKPKECKDDNPCTKDACQSGKGCVFPASKDPCNDGNACTLGDLCDGALGVCLPGKTTKTCDDGNLCTDDSCDPKGKGDKTCVFLPNKATCDEGDPCTLVGACDNGSCNSPGLKTCNDDNPCTADSCNKNVQPDGCVFTGIPGKCDDGNLCTDKDACVAAKGVCFGQNITCDDENVCTADSCDPKKGCVFKATQGSCGPFAKCVDPGDGKPACGFTGAKKVLISEIYVGNPCDPNDDFLELHSSLASKVDLGGYVVQLRPAKSENKDDWKTVAAFKKGDTIGAGGYLLLASDKSTLPGGVKPDVAIAGFSLDPEGQQIRIFDAPHTLLHDAVAWGVGAKGGEGKPLKPWPSQRSMERRATSKSTTATLAPWGSEWLAGNDADSGDNQADFIERVAPEPQGSLVYEPACGGTCTGGKVCDFAGTGAGKCVPDAKCAAGCGPGQKCTTIVNACVIDTSNKVLLSEVFVHAKGDAKAQFIELHNTGKAEADLSGLQLYVKGSQATGSAKWGDPVAQLPAGAVVHAKGYYLVATTNYAQAKGGVDLVVPDLKLDKLGGAIKLVDPRTDVELDRFGWGKSPNPSGTALSVSEVPEGFPMARKASAQSNGLTMGEDGDEELGGNARDTDNDKDDWLVLLSPTPHSLGSGAFGPACGGKCTGTLVCNYVAGADKCVDPTCSGTCAAGEVCNIKTGKCDLRVVISQFDTLGPAFSGGDKSTNEFIELYNPGHATASVGGMVLRYLDPQFGAKNVSPIFPTGVCVNTANAPCAATDKDCRCQGQGTKPCTGNGQCTKLTIAPHSYLLIVPKPVDPSLPKSDVQASGLMAMTPASGALQLIRTDGTKFPGGTSVGDQVCWGTMSSFGCKPADNLASFTEIPETCSVARKPAACSQGGNAASAAHAQHYQGNGHWTGLNQGGDWLTYCPRAARNASHPPQKP